MGVDDGLEVAIEHREALVEPSDQKLAVVIVREPIIRIVGWNLTPERIDSGSQSIQTLRPECRRVGDRVELEIVDLVVEVEVEDPVGEFRR